ncbi:MAG: 50S ribosomal protein L11 methyltransferase [Candidatus Nealsonbacteria bacterium]|nr:50S ribosomal protein L11 methyltransferase [Candidatus Nealsonbacteria bacterium]
MISVGILLIVWLFLFFDLGFLLFLFGRSLRPILAGGAFYASTREEAVKKMVALAQIEPGEKAVDLGSGDGRLVIALARAGAQAVGYEIDPLRAWSSRRQIRRAGLEKQASIHQKSFWQEDLSGFDVVTVYGVGYMMKRLEKKLRSELKAGARVVSNYFTFPTWAESQKEGDLHLYRC